MDYSIPGGGRPLVLVVDDDPTVRRSLHRLLRSADLDVELFACGGDLLAFERPGRRLCLVLDLHLPDMNGIDLLRQLAAADPGVPVVVLTGETDPEARARALQGGAVAFLAKPFEEDRLLEEILRALGRA